MDKNTVHEPELPGVHTYTDDLTENRPKKIFGGVSFTTPNTTLETVREEERRATHTARTDGKELFDVGRAFNDEAVQEGTIVTDKRRERHSFSNLMKAAFTEWWGQTQESVKAATDKMEFLKPKEIPTVIAPEERMSTILQAAEYARQAPRDDHKVVIEKIRTFAHDAEVVTGTPYTIKNEVFEDAPKWQKEAAAKKAEREEAEKTPVDTPRALPTLDLRTSAVAPDITKHSGVSLASYALKDTPQKTPLEPTLRKAPVVSVSKRPTPETPEKKVSSWTFFHETEDTKVSTPPPEAQTNTLKVPPLAPRPRLETYGEVSPKTVEKEPPVRVAPASKIIPPTAPTVSLSPVTFEYETPHKPIAAAPQYAATPIQPLLVHPELRTKKPIFKIVLIISIVILGSALGVFAAFSFKSPFPSSDTVPLAAPVIPSFLNTDAQIAIPFISTKELFLNSLTDLRTGTPAGVVQYYPVLDGDTNVVSANAVMEVLAPRVPGSFIRALSPYLMLGFSTTGTTEEPFIIIQSQNFDTLFAGMLEWEDSMSADLAPFFGTPVSATRVPNGTDAITTPRFTDALRSNRSIRILYDETGKERIVYAFVNKNLTLITTTTESLATLIGRIR